MWYVVQVQSGREDAVRDMIARAAEVHEAATGDEVLKECFVPKYQAEVKFQGEYRFVERNLLPGYVIVVTSSIGELNVVMRKMTVFTRVLGNDLAFMPLGRHEMAFINSFTTEKHRLISVSRAVAEGDTITVLEGPMVGHEGWIKQVNRRKGTARIETVMFGRIISVWIGLSVVSKTTEE